MHNALKDNADDVLYMRSNLKNLVQLSKEAEAVLIASKLLAVPLIHIWQI